MRRARSAELSTALERRLDQVCDAFERALRAGAAPRIEDQLADWTGDRSIPFAELLALELEYRSQAGVAPTPIEYQERFPDQERAICEAFLSPPRLAAMAGDGTVRLADLIGDDTAADSAPPEARHWPFDLDADNQMPLPEQFGRYVVEREIGSGSFGSVLLARDTELDRLVALKVPHPESVNDPADLEIYLTEARSVANLDHPGIVPVYDAARTQDGLCYVVSKYIEGCDLAEALKARRFSPHDAALLVARVAEAVHHAHQRGLVHRDIKPANILLDGAGTPLVTDFGLALHVDAGGQRTGFVGTPIYMSPEQARGEGHLVDGRSDIYSLGVVLYELLAGRPPFKNPDVAELLDQIVHAEVRPPRQIDHAIPKELERICLKAVAKNPGDRYTTAIDLAGELRAFASGRRPGRKRWMVAAGLAASLLVAGLAVSLSTRPAEKAVETASETAEPVSMPRSLRVLGYRGQAAARLGEVGLSNSDLIVNDDVRVYLELEMPAYCYLIAVNTDGSVQLCYPADPTDKPARIATLDFPTDSTSYFGLTDGPGRQAFVLLTSAAPLPPYADWSGRPNAFSWDTTGQPGAWYFDGDRYEPITRALRGTVRQKTPADFIALCKAFSDGAGIDHIEAISFPVVEQPGR